MEVAGNMSWRNMTNQTVDDSLRSAFDVAQKMTVIMGVLVVVLGLVFNVLLLVVLLGKKELRCDVRNMLIANLAVADLLAVGVLQPVNIALMMERDWNLGCYPHLVFQLLYFFAFSFVSVWGMVCVDALHLARLCHLDMPLTSFLTSAFTTSISVWKRRLDRAVVVMVVALPWVLSVVIITPVAFTGLHEFHKKVWTDYRCQFILVRWALLTLNILFFFLPCFLAFLLLSVSACVLCYRRRGGGIGTITPSMPPTITTLAATSLTGQQDRSSAYVMATLLTFVLMGPRHIFSVINRYEGLPVLVDVPKWVVVNYALKWLSESKSICLPLLWLLLLPDVRARAHHLLTLGRKVVMRVRDRPSFDPSVSYNNLNT